MGLDHRVGHFVEMTAQYMNDSTPMRVAARELPRPTLGRSTPAEYRWLPDVCSAGGSGARRALLVFKEAASYPVVLPFCRPVAPAADRGHVAAGGVVLSPADRGQETAGRVVAPAADRGHETAGGVALSPADRGHETAGGVVLSPADRGKVVAGRVASPPLTEAEKPLAVLLAPR